MSKLKSIWDAANELRGDLNNTYMFNTGTDTHLLYCASQGIYTCVGRYIAFDDERLVSTVAEFNELVEEMKTNFGNCLYSDYVGYNLEDKTPLEKEALNSIVNKPLVYTQGMADNGVELKIGMKAFLRGFQREILLGPDSDGDYITMNGEGSYDFDSANQFKPIDTRTKKEKAIDEIESELSKIAYSTRSALELAYDEWVGE